MCEYIFNAEKCWYKGVCNLFNDEDNCYAGCIRYMEMFYLMKQSYIPENMQYSISLRPDDDDLHTFRDLKYNYKKNMVEFVSQGKNLYLYSQFFGNGKTSWAIKLMQGYFDQIWSGNGFRQRAVFVSVPNFVHKIVDTINNRDPEFEKLKDSLSYVDLVVWDDIAACEVKSFAHNQLLNFIDIRILKGLSNIYTSNIVPEKVSEKLGGRLASRICNNSIKIRLMGSDKRKSK